MYRNTKAYRVLPKRIDTIKAIKWNHANSHAKKDIEPLAVAFC
jgi:hypothetical protein